MRIKFNNAWKDGSDFPKLYVLGFGVVDYQYWITILNFNFVLEL